MIKISIYSLILISSFILKACAQNDKSDNWKKLGELNLSEKNLIITISKNDNFTEKYFMFYLASVERTSKNNNMDAYKIGFYNGDFLMIDKENSPGGFEEEIYNSEEIKQDSNNYYLEIPNKFLFEENMRLWSAYEKEVYINDIKLYRKRTGKIDKKDPYPYILIIK
jgi:hypothetical protein